MPPPSAPRARKPKKHPDRSRGAEATEPAEDLQRTTESAKRLGVDLDEKDTVAWLAAIAAHSVDDVSVDAVSGTFGHRVAMLDFSPRGLVRFRKIGEIV